MKNLWVVMCLGMGLSTSAMAAAESFWVESIQCGEVDPVVVGDACLIELMNDGKHIALLVDFDQFVGEYSTDVNDYANKGIAVYMEELRNPSQKVEKVVREDMGLQNDVSLYIVQVEYIYTYPAE
jgi:hypothetical protein